MPKRSREPIFESELGYIITHDDLGHRPNLPELLTELTEMCSAMSDGIVQADERQELIAELFYFSVRDGRRVLSVMAPLKPCPFCGNDDIDGKRGSGDDRDYWYYECSQCNVRLPLCRTNSDAINAWNTRVDCN